MSISEIRKRWEQQRDDCPRCGGDGCDPEEYMPNRSQLQMDPDPCMECLPDLLAERNQFSQDIKTLIDRMKEVIVDLEHRWESVENSRDWIDRKEAILKELEGK